MKLNGTLILIVTLALAVCSGAAWTAGEDKPVCPLTGEPAACTADGPHGPQGYHGRQGLTGPHHRPDRMAAALDLTDEQRDAMHEIMTAAREATRERMEAELAEILTPEQSAQLEEFKTSRGDRSDLERPGKRDRMDRRGQRGANRDDMADRRLEHMTERLDLTPDQQNQVRQILEESAPPPRSEVRDRIRDILTPEQQEMMDQNRQQRPDKSRQGQGMGRQPRDRGKAGPEMGMPGRLAQQLDLTEEQRTALRERMAEIHSEQQSQTRSDIEALLTPAQREKLEELHQD